MKIIKAKLKDYKKIAKLRKDTFNKIIGKYYSKKQIKDFHKQNPPKAILKKIKERDMFCLINNNKILGVIDLQGNKIGGFFIRYSQIKRGHGTKLLEFIENYAKKKVIKKVILYATKYAYKFYIKRGYKPSKLLKKDKPAITKYFTKN